MAAVVSIVHWEPQGHENIFAFRFPETNLSTYTQLLVYETQEAILFSKGQLIGKFGPGKVTLNTENLPLLRGLYGFPFGGKNPYTAEVWFINKLQPYNIDWTIDRMDIHDNDYQTNLPLIAHGRYGLRIVDAEKFLLKLVIPKYSFDQNDLTNHFFGEFASKTKSTILQFMLKNRIGLKQVSAYLDMISEHLRNSMSPFLKDLGMELTRFYVTSIVVDDANEVGRRVLDAISRQSAQSIGGYTWQQEKVFDVANNAIEGFADSDSGLLGAVIATNMMGNIGGLSGGMMQPQYNQPSFGPAAQQNQQGKPAQSVSSHEVYCSNCSKKYPANSRFCPFCGDPYNPCPKCGTDNDQDAKRCVSCGTPISQGANLCVHCNSPLAGGASFCSNCGNPQDEGKCKRCGAALPSSAKFCSKCGFKK